VSIFWLASIKKKRKRDFLISGWMGALCERAEACSVQSWIFMHNAIVAGNEVNQSQSWMQYFFCHRQSTQKRIFDVSSEEDNDYFHLLHQSYPNCFTTSTNTHPKEIR
jgi:hypothetical protein